MIHRKRFRPIAGLLIAGLIPGAIGGWPAFGQAAPGATPAANSCWFDVAPTTGAPITGEPMALNVTVRCAISGGLSLRANSRQSASFVKLTDSAGNAIAEDNRIWKLPASPSGIVEARYRFELDAYLDETNNDMEGMRRGGTRVALLGGWMLQPLVGGNGPAVSIAVDLPQGQSFATALPLRNGRYVLGEVPMRFAGYAVFGNFQSLVVPVLPPPALGTPALGTPAPGKRDAQIELVMLDANYTATRQNYADWVRQSAQAIASYFDGFSSEKTLIVAFPGGGEGVQFGRVVGGGGVTVALRVGIDSKVGDLYQAWVLIHEMIHTAMPFVLGRGSWLMEGAATYIEPIIRSRVGWKSEDDVWHEWIDNMPRGVGALSESGLLASSGRNATYWGGALFMLLTDVEMRRGSANKVGLEDCLRDVLAQIGNTTKLLSVADLIAACDRAVGGTTMQDMANRYVYKATPLDLMALWRDLGVELVGGRIVYHDEAPLAAVRKAIVRGMRPPVRVPMGPA